MTPRTKTELKAKFNNGDIPTETDFSDWIDSISPGMVNFVIAANDAPARIKAQADYVCDGVNDEIQIQAAINALPVSGGIIRFSQGTFWVAYAGTVSGDVLDSPYCILIDAADPIIRLEGSQGTTIIKMVANQIANTIPLLVRGSSGTKRTNSTYIDGITFDGNSTNQAAAHDNFANLTVIYADEVSVTNCRFLNWKRNGCHAFRMSQKLCFSGNYCYGQGALRLENHNYSVIDNTFEDPNIVAVIPGGANVQCIPDSDVLYTIRLSSIMGNKFIGGVIQLELLGAQDCSVIGNIFSDQAEAVNYALYIVCQDGGGAPNDYEASGLNIIGNVFYNCANGIIMSGSGILGVRNCVISCNSFIDGPDRNFDYGIREGWGTTANNIFSFNNFYGTFATKISALGTGDIISMNSGYITENKGAAAALADGATIAHGLVATPTWVSLVGSVAGEIISATLLGPAVITVAIKKHDGTPGTAQTVYWEAKV